MWELVSTNLTGLGSRMGTERTWTNFRKHFKSLNNARLFAEKDYGKSLIFRKTGITGYTTGDLNYVAYTINKIKSED